MKTTKITITPGVYVIVNPKHKMVYCGQSRFCEYRVQDHFNKSYHSNAKEDRDTYFHKILREHPTGWSWKILEKITVPAIRDKAETETIHQYQAQGWIVLNKQKLIKE